jgi:transcription elongation factor GreA
VEALPKGKYYVTVAGAERLRGELEELERKRGEVAGNIRTAKAYGDLSENFEYHEAKREQGFVEGRIQQLKQIVPQLHVVEPGDVPADRVSFGSVVTVREENGEEWDLTIVGPLEADPMEDRISYESPLGEALVGQKVGDVVTAQVPAGAVKYEIIALAAYEA